VYLDQVGGQALPPIGVEVAQGGRHAGGGHPVLHGQHDDFAPGLLALHQLLGEEGVHQQVLQPRVVLVGRLDVVQEACADDAAALQTHAARSHPSFVFLSPVCPQFNPPTCTRGCQISGRCLGNRGIGVVFSEGGDSTAHVDQQVLGGGGTRSKRGDKINTGTARTVIPAVLYNVGTYGII